VNSKSSIQYSVVMGLEFVTLCVLLPVLHAGFAPIQNMAYPKKALTIAPNGYSGKLKGAPLIMREPDDTMPSNVIPPFTARLDKTIAWDNMDLCIEAGGASKNEVGVSRCTGGLNQKWNWVPDSHGRYMIELEGTKKCLGVKEDKSNAFPIDLRKCTSDVSESWEFVDVNTLSGRWSSENRLLSSELRHVLILLIAVAGVGALSFSAWWMQPKLSATNATPLNAGQQGGVALVSTEDMLVRKRADVNMQGGYESSDSPDFFDENSKEPKIGYTDGMDGSQGQMDKVNKSKKSQIRTCRSTRHRPNYCVR